MPTLFIARLIGALTVVGSLFWLVDAIGDRREAKVWRQINAAIGKTNAKIAEHETLDAKLAAIAEAARQKALADIKAEGPKATPEQAAAISRIR